MVNVAVGTERVGRGSRRWHFSNQVGGRKMSHFITHPALWPYLNGTLDVQGTHSLMDWIILACREVQPKEGDLPGYVEIYIGCTTNP